MNIFSKQSWIDNLPSLHEELSKIKLEDYVQYIGDNNFDNSIDKEWFVLEPGKDHYRLLAYISQQVDNTTILEVGALFGNSALAFSLNPTNVIYSFDVQDRISLKKIPSNFTFTQGDILEHPEIILTSKVILVDTWHHIDFELAFFEFLKKHNYKGLVILDDIIMTPEMLAWWESIEQDKLDVSSIGHINGTGLVFFT